MADHIEAALRRLQLDENTTSQITGLIDKVLANPRVHHDLLRRLSQESSNEKLIIALGKEIGDLKHKSWTSEFQEHEYGGYPPIDPLAQNSQSDSEEDDSDWMISDHDPESIDSDMLGDSDSDSEPLSDENLEDAVMDETNDDEEVKRLRREIRSTGVIPPNIQAIADSIQADEEADVKADETANGNSDSDEPDFTEELQFHYDEAYNMESDLLLMKEESIDNPRECLELGFGENSVSSKKTKHQETTSAELALEIEAIEASCVQLESDQTKHEQAVAELNRLLEDYSDLLFTSETPIVMRDEQQFIDKTNDLVDYELPTIEVLLAKQNEVKIKIQALGTSRRFKRKRSEYEAIREIKREQSATELIFDTNAFGNLILEVAQDFSEDIVFTPDALAALQTASEAYLIDIFRKSNYVAIHAGRTIIDPSDIQLTRMMIGERE